MELLENCSVLGKSPFPGDLDPLAGRTIRELGWLELLELLELLEMRPGTDWYQLPSSSSSSSSPAACHLADETCDTNPKTCALLASSLGPASRQGRKSTTSYALSSK